MTSKDKILYRLCEYGTTVAGLNMSALLLEEP
jgi:hypothetical protein